MDSEDRKHGDADVGLSPGLLREDALGDEWIGSIHFFDDDYGRPFVEVEFFIFFAVLDFLSKHPTKIQKSS